MLCTKSGYNCSVIFSRFAKSNARSKGILRKGQPWQREASKTDIPDALEMHRSNLDNVPNLFAFEYTIAPAPRHPSDIEEFGTINHVIVWTTSQPRFKNVGTGLHMQG